ncbi:MAG: DJ-1/PfpI family protein [Marinilabiliales bacterium]|nr:DJ-1/PfpI family protein [Marinilabiliales bacterium]
MKNSLLVHLAEGFEETEAITLIDVLRRADLRVITVSVTDELLVTGAHGITVKADQHFENTDYTQAEMILLPGGMPGTKNLLNHIGLIAEIKQFHRDRRYIAAICAAPMILGVHGMLAGKKAVCYPGFESYLTDAEVTMDPAMRDGHIITGRGVGTVIPFSFEIVKLLKGDEMVNKLGKALVIPGF